LCALRPFRAHTIRFSMASLPDPTPDTLAAWLAAEPAVLVTVQRTQGSVPRDEGTWMAVFADRLLGTIGGGHVEHEAVALARAGLGGGELPADRRYALGPSLGQCCGGVMHLGFERLAAGQGAAVQARLVAAQDARRLPVALFGGGHVGRAIVRALQPLPLRVWWVDSRDEIFPPDLPPHVVAEHSAPVEAAVADLASGSRVLVMSFSHAEDLEIIAACLRRLRERDDLPFVGLIGSRSKWATFRPTAHSESTAPSGSCCARGSKAGAAPRRPRP
jgi:xanthine dehydrogenase accessory factor